MPDYTKEIERRRTFAIISHPDAGKTTLTEKFLLYGGAINLAGSVKGKATAYGKGQSLFLPNNFFNSQINVSDRVNVT